MAKTTKKNRSSSRPLPLPILPPRRTGALRDETLSSDEREAPTSGAEEQRRVSRREKKKERKKKPAW